jgi:hypothetical protein
MESRKRTTEKLPTLAIVCKSWLAGRSAKTIMFTGWNWLEKVAQFCEVGTRWRCLDKFVSPHGRDLIVYCKEAANTGTQRETLTCGSRRRGPPPSPADAAVAQAEVLLADECAPQGPYGSSIQSDNKKGI